MDYQSQGLVDVFFVSPDFPFTTLPKHPDDIKETVITTAGVDSRLIYGTGSTDSIED
jgi:hypothetical protein